MLSRVPFDFWEIRGKIPVLPLCLVVQSCEITIKIPGRGVFSLAAPSWTKNRPGHLRGRQRVHRRKKFNPWKGIKRARIWTNVFFFLYYWYCNNILQLLFHIHWLIIILFNLLYTYIHTYIHTYIQAGRQTDRQTYICIYIYTCLYIYM